MTHPTDDELDALLACLRGESMIGMDDVRVVTIVEAICALRAERDEARRVDWVQCLIEFHDKFGLGSLDGGPRVPVAGVMSLREKLLREEHGEFDEASQYGNIVEVADALADIIYVAIGTGLEWGIDLRPVFAEVHRTNMLKVGGPTRDDGKILKPEGWEPPDIRTAIDKAKEQDA